MDKSVAAPVQSYEPTSAVRRHGRMHLLVLFANLCWSVNIVAGKEALRGFGPLPLTQLRVWASGLLLMAVIAFWRKQLIPRLARREWVTMGALALSGVVFNQLFFIAGLARTSVSHAALILALGPVVVLVLSCLMRLEALTALKLAGMLISFAGVAILSYGKSRASGGDWRGDLIVLAGSGVFAYYTIGIKQVSQRYDALTLTALSYGLGALLMTPFGLWAVRAIPWASLPVQAWWGLAYMVIFGSVIPYVLFAFALTELTASRVAAFNYLQPAIATLLAIWLLAEKLTLAVVMGGAVILLGVYLTERERGEESAPERAKGEV